MVVGELTPGALKYIYALAEEVMVGYGAYTVTSLFFIDPVWCVLSAWIMSAR